MQGQKEEELDCDSVTIDSSANHTGSSKFGTDRNIPN